jgi:hypothetical protein
VDMSEQACGKGSPPMRGSFLQALSLSTLKFVLN